MSFFKKIKLIKKFKEPKRKCYPDFEQCPCVVCCESIGLRCNPVCVHCELKLNSKQAEKIVKRIEKKLAEPKEHVRWEKLKKYLQLTHDEYSDRNGLPYCKNCGMSGEDLIKDFEKVLHAQQQVWKEGVLKKLRTKIKYVDMKRKTDERRYPIGYNKALSDMRDLLK